MTVNSLYDLDIDFISANYNKYLQLNKTATFNSSYIKVAEARVDYYYIQLIGYYANDIIEGVKKLSGEIYKSENLLINVLWSNIISNDFTDDIAVRKFYSYNDNYDSPIFLLALNSYFRYDHLSTTRGERLVKYCTNLLINGNLSKDVWRTVFVNLMDYIMVKGRYNKENAKILANILTNVAKVGVNIEDYHLGLYAIGFIQHYPNYATRELIDNSSIIKESSLVASAVQLLEMHELSDDIKNYLKIKIIESGRVNDYIQSLHVRRIDIESVENEEIAESIAETTDYFYQSLPDDYQIGVII